jgi:hypothetical protein
MFSTNKEKNSHLDDWGFYIDIDNNNSSDSSNNFKITKKYTKNSNNSEKLSQIINNSIKLSQTNEKLKKYNAFKKRQFIIKLGSTTIIIASLTYLIFFVL